MIETMRKVTLADVAQRAGVSRSLASLALRGEPGVQPDKRARIVRIAAELDYTPDPIARNLASARTRTVGVLVSDILNPFSASLARSIDAAARDRGLDVILSIDGSPDAAAERAISALIAQRVAGLILVGSPQSPDLVERTSRRVPVVYVGRQLSSERVDCVSDDDHLGATLLVRHLVEQGHRRIAHVNGGSSAGSRQRQDSYTAAMLSHGLEPIVVDGQHTLDGGAAAVDPILKRNPRPTAVFASNDLAAVGVINRLLQAGCRLPGDMAVVGYDDMPFAGSETMSLTTMRQPIDNIAGQSIDVLLARTADPRRPAMRVLIAPSIVLRRSSSVKLG